MTMTDTLFKPSQTYTHDRVRIWVQILKTHNFSANGSILSFKLHVSAFPLFLLASWEVNHSECKPHRHSIFGVWGHSNLPSTVTRFHALSILSRSAKLVNWCDNATNDKSTLKAYPQPEAHAASASLGHNPCSFILQHQPHDTSSLWKPTLRRIRSEAGALRNGAFNTLLKKAVGHGAPACAIQTLLLVSCKSG